MYVLNIVHNCRTQHSTDNFSSYPPHNHEGGDEVLCWCGYLSGARCKWSAYGPADATDATATSSSLASLKSILV